ncbi:MAG TPA: glucose-1-phosphate thymidylyltransferase [Planctomycetaceae bacterium]|nr:glucose-1-phosphate thymidylyltransferase [Planctomycetaceae bacterium]
MHIILFEDSLVPRLFPATIGKTAFELNVGSFRLLDLLRELNGTIEVVMRPYLAGRANADYPFLWSSAQGERSGPILVLNARAVPHVVLLEQLREIIARGEDGIALTDGHIACALLCRQPPIPDTAVGAAQLLGILHDANLPSLPIAVPLLEYAHDLVRYQVKTMNDNLNHRLKRGNYREVADGVFSADARQPGAYCIFDGGAGPIVIEEGVDIGPYCFFKGPIHIGAGAKIIEHSAIKDAVTLGATTKVGGEVEASVIEPYSNKQHHGFLGHSYLGSWVNLGAGTCNSDLKNTYGEVVMDYAGRKVKTGMQFVGCFVGDYAKTAINTSIFTGKTIGACSMVYGFVTTNVPSFVNYARSFGQVTESAVEVLIQTQARMFARRNVEQRPCDIALLHEIYRMTEHERRLANEPLSL